MSNTDMWKNFDNHNLSGYTLIIPSVAVGNVGQLACDLLISTLKMTKITSIYSAAQIPVVGYDPYDLESRNICGSCDVYKSDPKKLVIVQIRSPLILKYAKNFLENIVSQFQKKNIRDIIILTSSFAYEKKIIMSSSFRYIATDVNVYNDMITEAKLTAHNTGEDLTIYGGGYASLLYKICQEKSVPCLILFKYCSEGDNIPDAYDMVTYLNKLYVLFPSNVTLQLEQPISWKFLFGRPPPSEIY